MGEDEKGGKKTVVAARLGEAEANLYRLLCVHDGTSEGPQAAALLREWIRQHPRREAALAFLAHKKAPPSSAAVAQAVLEKAHGTPRGPTKGGRGR